MRINNNIMAMNTHRQYGINNTNVSSSVEKLSSGYRINRAGDDAAGLAISEKMRAQIRGLTMASKNSQDAISLVQTAEGALQTTHDILQRMREIAVQSSSDSNESTIDRGALNKEFQALMSEIDDTASKTAFNDQKLIDGTFAGAQDAVAAVTGATGTQTNTFATETIGTALTVTFTANTSDAAKDATLNGEWTFALSADAKTMTATNGTKTLTATNTAAISTTDTETTDFEFEGLGKVTVTAGASAALPAAATTLTSKATVADAVTEVAAKDAVASKPFVVQTGANSGDELKINIDNMDATSLGLRAAAVGDATGVGIDISSQLTASAAITKVNDAINQVSSQRADLGALQNRLEFKISNLDTSAENLQSAESRIRDLDMAKEMTEFTKNNILSQAATAMLAQANSLPQGVLQLLG